VVCYCWVTSTHMFTVLQFTLRVMVCAAGFSTQDPGAEIKAPAGWVLIQSFTEDPAPSSPGRGQFTTLWMNNEFPVFLAGNWRTLSSQRLEASMHQSTPTGPSRPAGDLGWSWSAKWCHRVTFVIWHDSIHEVSLHHHSPSTLKGGTVSGVSPTLGQESWEPPRNSACLMCHFTLENIFPAGNLLSQTRHSDLSRKKCLPVLSQISLEGQAFMLSNPSVCT
jgi:hypothetical protein